MERIRRLDVAVRGGSRDAARRRLRESSGYPGTALARGRAAALELLAADLPLPERERELAVASYLRRHRPRRATAGRGASGTAAEALDLAAGLRARGHPDPVIVVTLPALEGNPYAEIMERGFAEQGLAAVHVDTLDDATAAIDARIAGGFRALLLVNASNRLVWGAADETAAGVAASGALERIDRWLASGVRLVASVHDGPILGPVHAAAERQLAQGIADRADRIHVLTAMTPSILDGWLELDPGRCVHIPHPSYDGAYPPLPGRSEARAALGIDPVDPVDGGPEVVLGMLGLLSARKGPRQLLETFTRLPRELPDGRRLRLVLGGEVVEPGGEDLIRAAFEDPRIVHELGQLSPERMATLLAALDVAVVPYLRYLNSGWTVLALTHGIPVIAPSTGTAIEVVHPRALLTFDPDDGEALERALLAAPGLARPAARQAARTSVAAARPDEIARRFATLLRSVADESSTDVD